MPFKSDERNPQTEHIHVDRTISSTQGGDSVRDGGLSQNRFWKNFIAFGFHVEALTELKRGSMFHLLF